MQNFVKECVYLQKTLNMALLLEFEEIDYCPDILFKLKKIVSQLIFNLTFAEIDLRNIFFIFNIMPSWENEYYKIEDYINLSIETWAKSIPFSIAGIVVNSFLIS